MATRKQHMKKINKNRSEDTKRKILNCIEGMFAAEYKKPNGKWNITKICNDTGLHRNTVSNFLKNMKHQNFFYLIDGEYVNSEKILV